MSRSIDPQWLRALSKRQLATVDRRPEVVLARRRRDGLAQRVRAQYTTISRARGTAAYDIYREAHQAFLRTKKETRKAVLKEVKAQYRAEQPVSDILRQLRKGKSTEETGGQARRKSKYKS
jgi:non-homologous end joining protein Ku